MVFDIYSIYLHEARLILSLHNYVVLTSRYGQSLGEATGNTLYTVGNVLVAGNNVKHLTPKGIAKVAAKSTGKAVIEDYRKPLQEHNHTPGAGPSSKHD
jgi:hypothetical protein